VRAAAILAGAWVKSAAGACDDAAPAFDYVLKEGGVESRPDCARRFVVCDAGAPSPKDPLMRTSHYRLEAR
jgi:hypothetical protein